MKNMKQLVLQPIHRAQGTVQLPGSKSMSNRVLLLASLAEGVTDIRNMLVSEDTSHMLNALRSLGVSVTVDESGTGCRIQGIGGPFPATEAELFLGNSGTTMRSLCAAICLGKGDFTLIGEPRMYERPIKDLVDALRALGADVQYIKTDGYPPLRIKADGLPGSNVKIRGNISSQYLTGLLLAAPLCREEMNIYIDGELVSKPYISMTIDVMKRFGVSVENNDFQTFRVAGGQKYVSPGQAHVEGDASSATYFLSAGAIAGKVRVDGVGSDSVQGDIAHAEVLRQMGATVSLGPDWIEVEHGDLHGVDLDLNHMPDAAMTVAVTALFARGKTTIRNIYNWRVKETDRLSAMATELRKVGATVVEGNDYLEITPPEHIMPAVIDTYNDHRMAMCFSLAALGEADITINDPDCVSKTFPDYFDRLKEISLD
jgi:3-phosphoshikimate 1-carboxyvinyltransferase